METKKFVNIWKNTDCQSFRNIEICVLIYIPEWVIKNVEQEIFKFIWKGKNDKVKRKE